MTRATHTLIWRRAGYRILQQEGDGTRRILPTLYDNASAALKALHALQAG
jgi:hypothetical protein